MGLSNNLSNEKPVRVADEDLTFWVDRDLTSELVELEHFIGRHPVGNISVLCGFNFSKLADEGLNRVLFHVMGMSSLSIIHFVSTPQSQLRLKFQKENCVANIVER